MEDFRDFVAELVRAEARFLIVGAHALGVHGIPRATVDLDIWVESSRENANRLWSALAAFGAPLASLELQKSDFTRADIVVQIGLPPYRIDILTGVSGISFDEAWAERVEAAFEGVQAPFIGRAALIRNKRATGRTKDLSDLEALGEA
jgi:hypothetical protein